mmetsp:Transcript_160600/g.283176  ORF Transcript_160600/g.283176 Transcript_160600/m.283176 type:complete len:270 (-) Transcript_160600:42-851(-)
MRAPATFHSIVRWLLVAVLAVILQLSSAGVQKGAVEHVQCKVCELTIDMAKNTVDGIEENSMKDINKDWVTDWVDVELCNPSRGQGRWITAYDIVKEDEDDESRMSDLALVFKNKHGHCNNECLTIQRACYRTIKGRQDELSDALYNHVSAAKLKAKFCKKKLCKDRKKLPPLDNWRDEKFSERLAKEIEIEERTRKMEEIVGIGGKSFSIAELRGMEPQKMEEMIKFYTSGQERALAKFKEREERGDFELIDGKPIQSYEQEIQSFDL